MKSILQKIVNTINQFNDWIGKGASWFSLFLVVLIFIDVLLRYLFGVTKIWVMELENYFFAILFMASAGYAFRHDKHVRVDVFYNRLSDKGRAWVNLLGGTLFLLPWTWIVVQVGFYYAEMAFLVGESSPQQGGLPYLFLLKGLIFLGFFFLLLQAIASILQSVLVLFFQVKSLE